MKKKLLISLSSIGLAAGFWACGSGSVEPLNEDTDGYVRAMLETQSIDFASQVADAKKQCSEDIACMNEMAKANDGAIMIESSATPEPESSSDPPPQVSSSSRFNPFSSMGPIGQLSSSSSAPIPVQPSSSSEALPPGTLGTCAPAAATAELNSTVTWNFEWAEPKPAANVMLSATFAWAFEGGSPAVGEKRSASTSYATSGTKTASVTVNAGGATQTATCTVNVNGAPITGCTCLPTNIQPDVAAGESATWTASGCKTSANITGYTWTGATADATGLVATAPVAAKGDVVSGVSFTVSNDDNTKVTIKCDDAVAMDATKPDYEFKDQGNTNAISFTGNVDATVVFSLPSGWHGSDAGTCTFACQVDRGGSGDGKISGTLGTYEVAGGDYVTTSIPISATTGGNAMAFKLNVGSNAGVNCHVAW
jgi:hypothetical protein